MRKALVQTWICASHLRLSLFYASIYGMCKPGIACDFSSKMVKIVGFQIMNPHRKKNTHTKKQKTGEKGLPRSLSIKINLQLQVKDVLKIKRDRRGITDSTRLVKEMRTFTDEKFFSEES